MAKTNAIGWFDIYVNNLKRATKFYESMLNQKLEKLVDPSGETEMMAFPADMSAYGAAGALVKSKHAQPGNGGTMIYFSVEDCAVDEKTLKTLGGKLIRPKFSIGSFGYVSICEDTEGNLFGLSSMK